MDDPAEPALTRLVLVRHGETAWNAERRMQGHADIDLNARGRAQAAALPAALAGDAAVAVYASDLKRAWHTARPVADALALPLRPEPGLRERHFGMLQGLTHEAVEAQHPQMALRWRTRDPQFTPPGGESLLQFDARCRATVHRLAARHRGQAIVLVTHGGVLDCLYRAATHVAIDAPRSWPLGNAAVHRLLATAEGFSLVGWNDTAHLDALALDDSG